MATQTITRTQTSYDEAKAFYEWMAPFVANRAKRNEKGVRLLLQTGVTEGSLNPYTPSAADECVLPHFLQSKCTSSFCLAGLIIVPNSRTGPPTAPARCLYVVSLPSPVHETRALQRKTFKGLESAADPSIFFSNIADAIATHKAAVKAFVSRLLCPLPSANACFNCLNVSFAQALAQLKKAYMENKAESKRQGRC